MPPDDNTDPDDSEETNFANYRIEDDSDTAPPDDGGDEPASSDDATQPPDPATPPDDEESPPTRTIDLSEHQVPDPTAENPDAAVSDEVLAAMEEGKEAGTIREIDPEDPWAGVDDEDEDEDDEDAGAADGGTADASTNGSTPSQNPSPNRSQSQSAPSNGAGDELDFEGLSDGEDEWTWGQSKESVEFEYKGMTVVMSEPTDDEVLNALRNRQRVESDEEGEPALPDEEEEQNELGQLKLYAQLAIDSPEITDERWENHMTATERLSIGSVAAQYIDGGNFTDTPGSGQPVQPGS